MKKLISILLALTFVVSAMAFTASAAGEYYIFSFDSGLVNGSGLCGSQYTTTCLTGTYQLTPNNDSLDIRAWAVAASGIKEVKYNFNDTEWVVLPETAFVARDDIYNAATGTYGLAVIGENVSVAPLTPEFSFSIPTADLGLALDSTYIFQIMIVTNAGEEILIADLTVPYVEYSIDTTPVTPAKRGNCIVALDNVAAYAGETHIADHGNATTLTYNPGKIDTINFWGWISVDQAADWATAFGYSVDDGEIVYGTADWSVEPEDGVLAQPYDFESRFNINADVAGLELGTHTVKAYCQLSNGEQIILKSVTLELTSDRNEVIPSGIKSGIDSFTASSACNFDYDQYLDGSDLTQPSANFAGGSPFRAEWSPRPVAAAGMQVKVETVTDEATGETTVTNKYGSMWGFNTHYSDHDWEGAYTFTAAIKVPDATALSRGMFVNFSGSEGVDGAGNPMLYEAWCTVDAGYVVSGASGINVLFPNGSTMVVAVPTFNDAAAEGESAQGAIYAVYNLPNVFDTFATVEITDDNNGNVFVSVNGEVISKVTYADAGMFAHTYDQGYYKTATIWDYNNGGVVAETDKALIWKYKTVGFGTRACELHFDNIQIVPAKAVTEPEVKEPVIPEPPVVEAPDTFTFVENSKYSVDDEAGFMFVKLNSLKGDKIDAVVGNFAIESTFYQIVDAKGNVVTTFTRLTRDYKIQLLNADGTVNKEYRLVITGDCNGDGRITATDTSSLKSFVKAKYAKGTYENLTADVDGNGRMTATDTSALKKLVSAGAWA